MKLTTLSIAVAMILCSVSYASAHESNSKVEKLETISSESLFNLNSKWTAQDGKSFSLKDLRGKPSIIAMVYTSCEHACPMIIEDIKKIQKKLDDKTRDGFTFLLFSFDTSRDTPAKLKSFAETRKLSSNQWRLFHGPKGAVRELAAALGIRYKQSADGEFDHSNVITLLDSAGLIVYQQIGLGQNPDPLLENVNRISSAGK